MIHVSTLHDRRNELCKMYVSRMRRSNHKLNTLQPNTRNVPYTLRSWIAFGRAACRVTCRNHTTFLLFFIQLFM